MTSLEDKDNIPHQPSKKALKKQAFKERKALRKAVKQSKPKITKEERKAKYTQKARDKRSKFIDRKRNKNLICFKCRGRGHAVSECPVISGDTNAIKNGDLNSTKTKSSLYKSSENLNICYKCGSTEHALRICPTLTKAERNSGGKNKLDYSKIDMPYATCYICNEKGHLSSNCKQNNKGIYVKGGCCKNCGSVDHLYANCPTLEDENSDNREQTDITDDKDDGVNVDEFIEDEYYGSEALAKQKQERLDKENSIGKKKKARVVKF